MSIITDMSPSLSAICQLCKQPQHSQLCSPGRFTHNGALLKTTSMAGWPFSGVPCACVCVCVCVCVLRGDTLRQSAGSLVGCLVAEAGGFCSRTRALAFNVI